MTARETLVATLTNLFARTRIGHFDVHRVEAERLVDDALKEQAAGEFDALFHASAERAQVKRAARVYPYDLEVNA
jgi:hypothetical protein